MLHNPLVTYGIALAFSAFSILHSAQSARYMADRHLLRDELFIHNEHHAQQVPG
jgi:hypothetical protein